MVVRWNTKEGTRLLETDRFHGDLQHRAFKIFREITISRYVAHLPEVMHETLMCCQAMKKGRIESSVADQFVYDNE